MKVKLVGGPMNGRTVEIDEDAEQFTALWWTWEWTNSKENGVQLFALRPRSRAKLRGIKWFIEKFGHHPALESREQPYKKRVK